MPAIEADIRFAIFPPAWRDASFAVRRVYWERGSIPPSWMPIELRFAKPQSANVAMVNDGIEHGFLRSEHGERHKLVHTMRVPRRLPIAPQSRQELQ